MKMYQKAYMFQKESATRFTFISAGKRSIQKVVEFTMIRSVFNTFNLAFGDLQPDGSIDDMSRSDNGDIVRVMATLVQIILEFVRDVPDAKILFTGSTSERTALYRRILKTNYPAFSRDFTIAGIIKEEDEYVTISFDPEIDVEYLAFLIKKNI